MSDFPATGERASDRTETTTFLARRGKLLAALLIVLGMVAYLVVHRGIRIGAVVEAAGRFSLGSVAVALVLGGVQNLFQGSRLWSLLPGDRRPPWASVLRSYVMGQVVNLYVPARAGDLVTIALIRDLSPSESEREGGTARLVGSVLVADKIVDVGSILLLVAALAPAWFGELPFPSIASPWVLRGLVLIALLGALLLFTLTRRSLARVRRTLLHVARGSAGLVDLRRLLLAFGFGMAGWLSEAMIVIVLAPAIGHPLTIGQAVWVLVVLNLGIAVPVSLANIGTFEASLVFGLSGFGVPAPAALALATVHHLTQVGSVLALAAGFRVAVRTGTKPPEFRVQPTDKRRAVDHYERISSHYDAHVATGLLRLLRERERRVILGLARFDDPSKKTMIDVGCGGGAYTLAAKRAGLHVSAVDVSPGMIRALEGKVDAAWVGDIESLSPGTRYDLVTCIGVLDFVLDPEGAFRNLAALVAPGGRLVIHAPRAGLGGLVYRLEKKMIRVEVNLFSIPWFKAQATEHGLELRAWQSPLPTNRTLVFERARSPERPVL